jgi:hypothetical protein
MIDRRTWLKSLGGILPAGAGVRIEAPPSVGDLVVITLPGPVSQETAMRLKDDLGKHLPAGVKVLVLCDGATLHVERAIKTMR